MFSFKGKIFFSVPHHTKTTLDELREGEIKFYPRLANALHYQTGMMTELQLNESSDWVSHQYGLIVTIFLTGVINRPSQSESVSQSSPDNEEQKSVETHDQRGYGDCNI